MYSVLHILVYVRGGDMKTAKVFKSGNSQARQVFQKDSHLEGEEVEIRRKGGVVNFPG